MLTLHNTTEYTKTLIKWGIVFIIAIFILTFVYRMGISIKEYFYPTPPAPPTVSFGKLPSIVFSQLHSSKSFIYSLDTLTGTLPTFPDRATVYKILVNEPNLLALQRAQDRISRIGFNTPGSALTNTLYEWKDKNDSLLSRNLLLDIQSFDFTLSSEFLINPDILKGKDIPNETDAKSLAQSFLSNISSFPDDVDTEKTKTTLFSIKNSSVLPATSLSNTQLIRVDFFQKDINKLPIYYPNPPYSTMNIFVSGGNSSGQVVEAHFFHRLIDTTTFATYPIKTANEAYEQLKKGDAYIASAPNTLSQIAIKNISLGYYMSDKDQAYILPIIIFQGDSGFYAYVSAITEAWVEKETK